ncbi:Uncharacterised protein [Mycobacteroides abscessus subsp. abscessus]|nr:Uncharacterised protein [Mycobacteroides abscessus subsp. abscessus]
MDSVPNSSTASASSASLVRTALSTFTTMDLDKPSSAVTGCFASASASEGSMPLAASISARRRERVRNQENSMNAPTNTAPKASAPRTGFQGMEADEEAADSSPVAVLMAAPSQSDVRSAGSIVLVRRFSISESLTFLMPEATWNA